LRADDGRCARRRLLAGDVDVHGRVVGHDGLRDHLRLRGVRPFLCDALGDLRDSSSALPDGLNVRWRLGARADREGRDNKGYLFHFLSFLKKSAASSEIHEEMKDAMNELNHFPSIRHKTLNLS
jgi:hypothetical protein